MIIKLHNTILDCWELIDNAEKVRPYRRRFSVKSQEVQHADGSGAENHFVCFDKDDETKHFESVTFLTDPSLAMEHDQQVQVLSYQKRGKEAPPEFLAFEYGFILTDDGKTIEIL
jgi:hypothetical protein